LTNICDYEGSKYRADFWENQNREYEDRVERIAMRTLLPPHGKRLVEIGAGFGRLADLYDGYEQVILMDYARSQLEEARRYLGDDERFIFVVADIYKLPFVSDFFDALTMVRVMHHLADVPMALSELYRVMAPAGTAVVEHASKFHLKALLRWMLGRQQWNPFDRKPHEFVSLNFDFHPAWIRQQLAAAGFVLKNTRTVSHYRIDWLKRTVPLSWLVWLDGMAQSTGNMWQLTPSLFLQMYTPKQPPRPSLPGFFLCPTCRKGEIPVPEVSGVNEMVLSCGECQCQWLYKDGIFDFKTPRSLCSTCSA
jgi:ubiquinone/menaquinone biosynthesis C-methylase UbiE